MTDYPEALVDHELPERCRRRFAEAQANRARLRADATDAQDALRAAEAARDALVLRSSKEGGVHAAESLAAHRAVSDAEARLIFLREGLVHAESEITAAQRALNEASGEAHRNVLEAAIDARVEAAGRIDQAELALAEAKAAYDAAGALATLAQLRGAKFQNAPILERGPYGRPGEHEQAEKLAWGLPPRALAAE